MSPVASLRHRAPARYRVYISPNVGNLIFVEDTWTDDIVAGPFYSPAHAQAWINSHK